jgi:hypothetical protein
VRVPVSALLEQVRENDANMVFLVDAEQKARLAPIRIGNKDPLYAEVTKGLNPGDRVVVQGKEILSSGQPLKTTDLPAIGRNVPSAPPGSNQPAAGNRSLTKSESAQEKTTPEGSVQ